MTAQFNDALPQESEAQRIGRYAAKCFVANVPNTWQETELSGGGDYGYDYQVQIIENGLAKDVFRVQLKGTTSPTLIENGSVYSQTIKISTANYYGRATEPVLLVVCDLTVDPETPKNCPLYYAWIHDEIQRLLDTSVKEDQKSLTFHVPKADELTATTDISGYIKRFRTLSRLGHNLDSVVESDRPTLAAAERAEVATKIVGNLNIKSAALIDALAEDESSWVEAPAGSLHWHLRESLNALQRGRGADCDRSLNEAAKLLDAAKPLEKADYWNLVGRLRTFNLNDEGAKEAFETACSLSGDIERHLIPWAEAELRCQFHGGNKADFSSAIARLSLEKPAIAGMRARLIAAEGRYDDAIEVTEGLSGVERNIARAIIFSMQARWDETISECEAGLSLTPLRQTTEQLFLILRARSRFSKAIGPVDFGDAEEGYLPAPGPAETDVSLLHQAWKDIAEAITTLRSAGWPGNVELVADMWSATATMLGLQDQAVPLMAEAAKARPTLRTLQAGLESMAAQAGQFKIALEANERQPESPRSLQQRIALLHAAKRHRDCVKLLEERWDIVADDSLIFGFSLIQGIHSAERIIQPDRAIRWRSELESRTGLSAHAALFNYFETKLNRPLETDAALAALIKKYEALDRPKLIAKHLLQELDGTNQVQAKQCLEAAETVRAGSMLGLDDLTHIAQALTTLGRWDDLLALSRQGLAQFAGNDRLQAIGAIALDKLGRTAEAHALLKSLVEKNDADGLALAIYIRIASRSGFADQAMAAIEKVFGSETDQAKQLECLRHMFALLQQAEPTSQRLVEIAWKIGEFVKQEDEAQEGLFLTTMFAATLPASARLNDERRSEFQRRLGAFTTRFPNSRILKSVTFPSDASGTDLIRLLEKAIGSDEQQRRNRERLQRELSLGIAPIPYAWRPRNVLDSISELPTLWEVSKHSSWGARHLHLTMATQEWKAMEGAKLRGQVPLLDFLSLMVLSDLELLEPLFKLFPRIAIGKATMMELQHLLAPLAGSLYRNKLLPIQATLKAHFADIEQPEATPPDDDRFVNDHWNSLEIIEIAKGGKYLVYSDDVLFRIYSQQPSICTLDLLCALDEAGEVSAQEAARKIAKLCSWRVGVCVTERYQLAIIPDALGKAKSISEGIAVLDADESTKALLGGIWNIEKQYGDLQGHAGIILRKLADDTNNSIKSVAALAGFWLDKVRLHTQAPTPLDRRTALLIAQATFVEHTMTCSAARRLWSVYGDLIEDIHGNYMDDKKLRQSIRIMGEVAAESDRNHSLAEGRSLRTRLAGGLTEGTSDYDLFNGAYSDRMAVLEREARQR
jgi:tetratricopeptide (TPR) repeat protein